MNVLIIEDENLAADRLIKMIHTIESSANILGKLESVRAVIKWFSTNNMPDLVFMDVQLADGICFEIFEKIKIEIPVIFTTAYNEYALKAFKVNSIDYLLKPIDEVELQLAIEKFKKVSNHGIQGQFIDQAILGKVKSMLVNPYKLRFIVRIGEHIKTINVNDISFIYSNDKATFIRLITGRDYAIDGSIDLVMEELDPTRFFRVSRKYLISLEYITDIIAYSGSRLKIVTKGIENEEIIVSREKVSEFKKWLEGI